MGYEIPPSDANFVMVLLATEQEAARVTENLLCKGIIVRRLTAFGLPHAIRVSTGTDEENRLFVEALSGGI
jgi:histidinol-phosphate aminotransferase